MNLRRLGAIVLKELRQLRRDKLTFAMIAGIPLLELVLFGYAINMDVRGIEAAVLDQANTARSREAVAEIASSQVLDIQYHLHDPQQLDSLLRQGKISAVLVVPRDFEGETFVSLAAGSSGRHLVDSVFARDDVRRVLRVETSLSEIRCGMVSSGLGVAISDPFPAKEFEGRGVAARRFEPRIDFEFAAVFPPQRSRSPVAEDLVDAVRRAVAAMADG